MDDEDGRCLLDVICDPQALNDFLHGSETHLDTDDLLDGSSDPSSSFFSTAGGHVPEVQAPVQLSAIEPPGLPRVSVDLDFLEDDDILGGSPGGGGDCGSNGIGTNHEPCDILQQSLAEANITEQSLQEAEAELDLGSFGIPGLAQVVQTLPDASLSGAGGTAVGVGIGVGVGGATTIFPGSGPGAAAAPPNATADMLGSVLAHQGLQLQPQVMNKAISVQPFMQQMGLGNMTLQSISSLQALPNGSQSGHLGIGQIQVMGQPTVMTINQSGQQILAKAMGGYQLHQSGPETAGAGAQAGLGASVLSSGGGLLIQGGKATLGSPALNGPAVCVSSTNSSGGGVAVTSQPGLVGFGGTTLGPQSQGQIMQNVIIQRTPTPIQPKPPQGGAIQPKIFKQQQQQQQQPLPHPLQNDANKALGVQQVPVSAAQNVAFLTGKPGSNVVLSTQNASQSQQFQQALFKQQTASPSGKPLSVLLNQSGSIVQLQGQNHQFLLPQLQAGGQILTQHPGGHIITSQGPGGQLITNQNLQQLLAANQNINLSQMLASQGHPGAAHILSGHIQLQPGQMGHPTLFQMPVTLAQTQSHSHPVTGHAQTVIQGMPIQNSLAMLSQVEGLSPAVSLQPALQTQAGGGVPSGGGGSSSGAVAMAQGQPGESVTVPGSAAEQAAHPGQHAPPQSSILTVQPPPTAAAAPGGVVSVPSSSPSLSVSTSSSLTAVGLPQAQHSPGRVLFTPQGTSMILSQESLQMFLQQDRHQHTENDSAPSVGVPASVIVSSSSSGCNTGPAPSGHDSLLAESRAGQSPSPSPGPAHMVKQVPSAGHQQPLKIQSMSPSQPLATHTAAPPLADSPQPQHSPLTLGQHIQSPHHQQQQSRPPSQPQPQTPSRSCTPSSLPPLFIVHNQLPGSPQPAQQQQQQQQQQPQQAHIQVQLQLQPQARPPSQPAPFQPDMPPASCSPTPPQAPPAQFQFAAPTAGAPLNAAAKAQAPLPGLTAEQQHHLQLVGARLQTLSSIAQPSPQQKQLLDKLHLVQHNIFLQAKQHTQAQPQFGAQQDAPVAQAVTSAVNAGPPAQLPPLLQQTSVLVKAPVAASNDLQIFSGAQGPSGATVNQVVTPASLTQSVQPTAGVISSVGGLSLAKAGMQIQVLGAGLSQMALPQPPAPAQTQTATVKMPFSMEPSKEARMLEQLRKQQGSVLHPDHSSPFRSFEDTLHRLLPYHLYQGTTSSPLDYRRVDDEFESVSSQLLRRTQAMIDKYRHLLFEESKRLGPSAEMVMIDRMFIQEEKIALSQDRILAKERPDEYVFNSRMLESAAAMAHQRPLSAEPGSASGMASAPGPAPVPTATATAAPSAVVPTVVPSPAPVVPTAAAPPPGHFPPTKLVIKQGGGGASVSWSSSCPPAPSVRPADKASRQSSSFGRSPPPTSSYSSSSSAASSRPADDDDALPQRTSKPPMKTYEARRRIGLKLKIKQEAGFSKVVHNTALDPVHRQPQQQQQQHSNVQPQPRPPTPEPHPKARSATPSITTVIRTSPPACSAAPAAASSSTPAVAPTQPNPTGAAPAAAAPPPSSSSSAPPPPSSSSSSSSSSSHAWPSASSAPSSTAQMNGTLEHHDAGGVKRSPASTATPPQTTCRLPLRKTYRVNVSPRVRPGVPGGGGDSLPYPRPLPSSPPAPSSPPSSASERTVIASVTLEKRGGAKVSEAGGGEAGGRLGDPARSPDRVEDAFYRGVKNTHHRHRRHRPPLSDDDEEEGAEREVEHAEPGGADAGRHKRTSSKNRQRAGGTFRMDQHAPGPPSSPPAESRARDSSLPAKRCKSDSPDMDVDNASFSSGSPPDHSLTDHLQSAIDSILNLQQGPSARRHKGGGARHHHHHHHHQRPGGSAAAAPPPHRPSVPPSSSSSPASSPSLVQRPQVAGRGHNGSLVPQTHSR